MMVHGRVPAMFGIGVVVPLIKGKHLDNCLADNYRGITLSPHISKLFEMCILDSNGNYLLTFSLVSRKGLVVIMLCILSDQ